MPLGPSYEWLPLSKTCTVCGENKSMYDFYFNVLKIITLCEYTIESVDIILRRDAVEWLKR